MMYLSNQIHTTRMYADPPIEGACICRTAQPRSPTKPRGVAVPVGARPRACDRTRTLHTSEPLLVLPGVPFPARGSRGRYGLITSGMPDEAQVALMRQFEALRMRLMHINILASDRQQLLNTLRPQLQALKCLPLTGDWERQRSLSLGVHSKAWKLTTLAFLSRSCSSSFRIDRRRAFILALLLAGMVCV